MLDKQRIRRIHGALSGAKLMQYKQDWLSNYGVSSTKELTAAQADDMIQRLNEIPKKQKENAAKAFRSARSACLVQINKLGIYMDNGDWSKVNEFLLQPRIAGKLLFEMNLDELKALKNKLYAMVKKRQAADDEIKYKETNN